MPVLACPPGSGAWCLSLHCMAVFGGHPSHHRAVFPSTYEFSRQILLNLILMRAASSPGRIFPLGTSLGVLYAPRSTPPFCLITCRQSRASCTSRTEEPRPKSPQDPGAAWVANQTPILYNRRVAPIGTQKPRHRYRASKCFRGRRCEVDIYSCKVSAIFSTSGQ